MTQRRMVPLWDRLIPLCIRKCIIYSTKYKMTYFPPKPIDKKGVLSLLTSIGLLLFLYISVSGAHVVIKTFVQI